MRDKELVLTNRRKTIEWNDAFPLGDPLLTLGEGDLLLIKKKSHIRIKQKSASFASL